MDAIQDARLLIPSTRLYKLEKIKKAIYTHICYLSVKCKTAAEPVENDEGMSAIKIGQKWGKTYDCSIFEFFADVPAQYKNEQLYAIVDIGGEGLVTDLDGNPQQGISHVFNIFHMVDFFNSTVGKTVFPVELNDNKVNFKIEGGYNGFQGFPVGHGKLKRAELVSKNTEIYNLYFDYLTLSYAAIAYKGNLKKKTNDALNKSFILFSKKDYVGARAILKPCLDLQSEGDITFTAVGHSHLDLAWLWPIRETKRKAMRTMSTAIKNMELYPDYVYGASQPQQFEWIKETSAILYQKIKDSVKNNRLELQGGMWVECDTNIPCGESLIRQFVFGKRFWKEEFGVDVKTCWLPDVFGYTAALPQIMLKCGCDFFMTQKLSWNEHNKFPLQTFKWQGLSSDEILAHLLPCNSYSSSGSATALIEGLKNHMAKDSLKDGLMCYGAGDGGGGPGEANLEMLVREKSLKGLPKIKFGRAIDFFNNINAERNNLPSYKGELYFEKHQGTYTSQARTKKYNRKIEYALHNVETLGAYAATLGYAYPKRKIDEIWKEVLLYQFHDILPGSSIHRVYEESSARYEIITEELEIIKTQILDFIKTNDTGASAINLAPFERKEYIYDGETWYMSNLKPYSAAEVVKAPEFKSLSCGNNFIENEYFKITFNRSGEISSMYDKLAKVEAKGKFLNRLNVYMDKRTYFDAWDIDMNYTNLPHSKMRLFTANSSIEGPRAIRQNVYQYNKSALVQEVYLEAGKPYVVFDTKVDWRETHKMLRAEFMPSRFSKEVICDIQFGNIKRSTLTDNSINKAQFEICAHKYIDVSDPYYGFAVMTDCKYGYRVKNGLISLNLLRSAVYPDKTADKGRHHFKYAFMPHSNDLFTAEIPKYSYLFNMPAIFVSGKVVFDSLVTSDKRNVIIETVKPAENGEGIIVRLYENEGRQTTANIKINLPYKELYITNMLEQSPISTAESLIFNSYEVKTLLII